MAELYTYNSTHLTTIRDGTVEFTQCAELGTVGTGRFAIDDTAGTLSIVGQKDFLHTESACANTRTFRGFIDTRNYGRDAGVERAPHVGAARGIAVELEDLNAMLSYPGLTGETANRGAETVSERVAWLLAHDRVSGLFVDNGRVAASAVEMDEADYRQQMPGDVLADCALAANGFNYYIADWGSGPELTFRNDNTSTADSSTLRISNVLADASAVTLHPFKDATLRRDPSVVKTRVSYNHANGTVQATRAATEAAFNGERYFVLTNSNVKTDPKALNQANEMLFQLSTEEDIIECTVRVTAAQVNLIRQGERIQAKFSHLATEGYGTDFVWFRVLERTVRPANAEAADYELRLKLSPQEAADPDPPGSECTDDPTDDATYYPLGGAGGVPNLVGSNIAYYSRGGYPDPFEPDPTYQGDWNFATFQAGGAGTIDYFASGFQNTLRFVVVGNGTLSIETERWMGQPQPYTVTVYHRTGGNTVHIPPVLTGIAGDGTEVEITEADDPDCIHLIDVEANHRVDGVHIGMGWSSATWVGS